MSGMTCRKDAMKRRRRSTSSNKVVSATTTAVLLALAASPICVVGISAFTTAGTGTTASSHFGSCSAGALLQRGTNTHTSRNKNHMMFVSRSAGGSVDGHSFGSPWDTLATARTSTRPSSAGIAGTTTALLADLGGTNGAPTSNSNPTGSSHYSSNRRSPKTAMESAILVEWEPISELERRIEDGVHYEHFPDFEHVFGSEEAMRLRKRAAEARDSRNSRRRSGVGGGGGGGGGKTIDMTTNDASGNVEMEDEDIERVKGVFVGFRATKEETDRLRSADPNETVDAI